MGDEPKAPVDAQYAGGRRIQGLGVGQEVGGEIAETHRKRIREHNLLENSDLVTLALEMGFAWDAFGTKASESNTLQSRAPKDAEVALLQMTNPVPLAMVVNLFGGTAPSVCWTDLGVTLPMEPSSMDYSEHKYRLFSYYLAIYLVQNQASAEKLLGEAVNLVISCQSYDGNPYEITIGSSSLGAIFQNVPRVALMRPKVDFDPTLGHRVITGFDSEHNFYFISAYLRGQVSLGVWGIEDVRRIKEDRPDKNS